MKACIYILVLTAFCAHCFAAPEPGLLFYLSGDQAGDQQFNADFSAGGSPEPNYLRGVTVIPGGARGSAFQCDDSQLMTYWAPGNLYGQRGTLSFFWRSRYAVGPTEFPVFRVAYADSTTWDMTWLRIDYNGHGFDAFVTDASLARTRVSVAMQPFPKPNEWTHLALSWDETRGIRFYVNGKLAAVKEAVAVYNTGLDQFGPHSRIISPHQVQSSYMYVRGGDIDEIRTYDRMLSDDNVATLAKGDAPVLTPLAPRDLSDARYRDEWWLRYGWNRLIDPPPYYPGDALTVRKVEIHDSYDGKRWFWKATDGIRETTWPGVYNRSRLPGRDDYFDLPDWDCYVDSGKAITFVMPQESWNHIEISGAAWGKMELLEPNAANDGPARSTLFRRPKWQEKTVHTFAAPITGGKIRFTNDEQEEPIGELAAYNVSPGREPQGTATLAFTLNATAPVPASLDPVTRFIRGRFPADERQWIVAQPAGAPIAPPATSQAGGSAGLPLVHILIPDTWDKMTDGLDGIAIDLPALTVKPTHGELFPLNIQVKDPDWLYRDMLDFTFSVKPGEAKTLWLDLRDRILPLDRGFYITIAGAGADFGPAALQGARIRLIFKSHEAARPEHELDRFTQVRDNFAMMQEEHPANARLNLWNRYIADLTELMRVNPNHPLGIYYAARSGLESGPLPNKLAPIPPGTPAWAFRQVELVGRYKRFVDWFIDHRQSAFGDFGGGLSDDNDLTNIFPGIAFIGSDPDKITDSLRLILEAHYKNNMFTNGINTLQTDYLHSFEEGTNCLGQNLILDYGNPRQIERAMESARGVRSITGINAAGDRLIESFYFSATKVALDEPWGWSRPECFMMLQPSELLVQYNDNPTARKFLAEVADGQLHHRHVDPLTGRGSIPASIRFVDGAESRGAGGEGASGYLFWTLWMATGDNKYLDPLLDAGGQALNPYSLRFSTAAQNAARSDFSPPPDGTTSPNRPATADAGNAARGRAGIGPAAGGRAARGGGGGGGGSGSLIFSGAARADKQALANAYASAITDYDSKEYLYTDGNFWIDRTLAEGSQTSNLQRTRLGGIVHNRNDLLPGNVVSWRFHAPANDQSVALIVGDATTKSFTVVAYNLDDAPVSVTMTGWNIDPGIWDIVQGIDTHDDNLPDQSVTTRSEKFEAAAGLELTFAPHVTTVVTLKLKTPGTPYWKRPDLGISKDDLFVQGNTIGVTVHSIGAVDATAATLNLVDNTGKVTASAPIPALPAPLDLFPRTARVTLTIPPGMQTGGASVVIDPGATVEEITTRNNRV
ncbi:MAG TPA: LamG-like jellyroll fold domain-containing protein, partial [Phycisphaerae bacterium]